MARDKQADLLQRLGYIPKDNCPFCLAPIDPDNRGHVVKCLYGMTFARRRTWQQTTFAPKVQVCKLEYKEID